MPDDGSCIVWGSVPGSVVVVVVVGGSVVVVVVDASRPTGAERATVEDGEGRSAYTTAEATAAVPTMAAAIASSRARRRRADLRAERPVRRPDP
ncbi:MAG: hypothetical protein ABSE98_00315 [Acidimicrobiales bacterium]